MPHFFINSQIAEKDFIKIVDSDNYRHIAKSLRAKCGEKLLLIDENQIQYETVIEKITSSEIICKIEKKYLSKRDLEFNLYLAQSPLRSDAQLTLVEKATELGVRGIYPIITENCALATSMALKKSEKWQRVMYEASKQCERAKVPTCYTPSNIETVLKENHFHRIFVMAERSTELSLKDYLTKNPIHAGENVLVIIGPEGGFSQKEFDYFRSNCFPLITLGELILKAETAVTVTIGNIIYEYKR